MFGPGGGPPSGVRERTKLVKQFDKNSDGWLNNDERKAARAYLDQQGGRRRTGGPGGRRGGFRGPGEDQSPATPGRKLTPGEVQSFPDAPLYASNVLRTLFLEFENADWEKELADFKGTDVEVPAQLTVDGRKYRDVGVHFRGGSSFMMVGEGRKRSLNLSIDFLHADQRLYGYRTLNLLNSHGDPTFLRTVLSHAIARDYLPAPQANWVRVVINRESWGIYVNAQQFNKDFVKEWFGTTKGARWKVPGSPNGRGSLAYLGEDAGPYKRIYEIKSKDEPQAWAGLIKLCKVLNETPADQLEAALAPLLDIDGALKFLAAENALINNDGYWTRTSDYDLYQDAKGRFHVIPYDANETFMMPGGPGFGGGPGGPRGGGAGFPGGGGGFGPGMFLARQIFTQADRNGDQKVTKEEFTAVADAWFDKLDPEKTGKVNQQQFAAKLPEILPPPPGQQGLGPRGGGIQDGGRPFEGGRRGFGPAPALGPGLFPALDANKDGSLTRTEIKETFAKWFGQWDKEKSGALNEEQLRRGLTAVLPRPDFGRQAGGPGMRAGRRGPGGGGFGGGPRVNGVELDPLLAAYDPDKPLISRLLAVESLRTRYLGYVRDIAEKWLDWKRLGPLAMQYQALIADEVKDDTRKLSSFEAFQRGVAGDVPAETLRGPERGGSLKNFAEQRRAYLLKYSETKRSER